MALNSLESSPNFGGFGFGFSSFLSSYFLALGSIGFATRFYFLSFLASLSSLLLT